MAGEKIHMHTFPHSIQGPTQRVYAKLRDRIICYSWMYTERWDNNVLNSIVETLEHHGIFDEE